jgi:hypothetical protein
VKRLLPTATKLGARYKILVLPEVSLAALACLYELMYQKIDIVC